MAFALFEGPFGRAGCIYKQNGWVTTDLKRGQRLKWCPTEGVIENPWLTAIPHSRS